MPDLRLVGKEAKTVRIPIVIPKDASPGGHFGVIRFTATSASPERSGVSLSASLGSLVLLHVNGEVKEDLSVLTFETVGKDGSKRSFFETGPVGIVTRFENKGNVHVAPLGGITIKNMFGKEVQRIEFSNPPRNVLPESIRRFEHSLDKKWMFGRYTVELNTIYGDNQTPLTEKVSFWVIPWKLLFLFILVIAGLFFGLRAFMRTYNRRVIDKARRQGGSF